MRLGLCLFAIEAVSFHFCLFCLLRRRCEADKIGEFPPHCRRVDVAFRVYHMWNLADRPGACSQYNGPKRQPLSHAGAKKERHYAKAYPRFNRPAKLRCLCVHILLYIFRGAQEAGRWKGCHFRFPGASYADIFVLYLKFYNFIENLSKVFYLKSCNL